MFYVVRPRFTGPLGGKGLGPARYIGRPGKLNREIHLLTHKASIRGKRKGPVNRGFTVFVFVQRVYVLYRYSGMLQVGKSTQRLESKQPASKQKPSYKNSSAKRKKKQKNS